MIKDEEEFQRERENKNRWKLIEFLKDQQLQKDRERERERETPEGPCKSFYVHNGERLRNVLPDTPGSVLHFSIFIVTQVKTMYVQPVTGINPLSHLHVIVNLNKVNSTIGPLFWQKFQFDTCLFNFKNKDLIVLI